MSHRRSLAATLSSTVGLVTGKYLAYLAVVASAIVILVNWLTLNSYYVFSTILAVFFGCALYAVLKKSIPAPIALSQRQLSELAESRSHKVLTILFFCLLTVCIVLLSTTLYSRPPLFFVLTCLLAALIAIEIAVTSNRKHTPSILLKTIILGIIIRISVYFEFRSPIVADPWWHTGFIQYVLDYGHIPAQVAPYSSLEYPWMPMMHLLITAVSLSTGIGLDSSYFFLSIIECISVVLIFLIGRAVINERTGLLAALLLIISNQFILWGIHITPLTLGVVLTLVVLVVLFLVPRSDLASFTALLLVLLTSVLLTHEGAAAYTAIVLVAAVVVFGFVRRSVRKSTNSDETQNGKSITLHLRSLALVVVLFLGALIGYWFLLGGPAAYRLLAILNRGVQPSRFLLQPVANASSAAIPTGALPIASLSSLPLYNDLSVLLFILFATFGLLYLTGRERKALTVSWASLSALMLAITAVIYFAGGTAAIPERWIVYLQLFMAIPAAVAILALSSRANARTGLAVIFSAVIIFGLVGITNSNAKVVNELPWDQRPRIALEQSEVSAAATIANKTNGGPIKTDFIYYWSFEFQLNSSKVTVFSSLSNGNVSLANNTTLVLRTELANSSYLAGGAAVSKVGPDKYASFVDMQNVVYDTGTVQVVPART